MGVYRSAWSIAVTIVAVAAVIAGGTGVGWFAILLAIAAIAAGGAAIAYAWVEEPGQRRRRAVVELSLWFGVGAAMVLGLPELFELWWPLVPAGLAVTSPRALGWAVGWAIDARRRSCPPVDSEQAPGLTGHDLEARWSRTTRELHARAGQPAAVLALVQEREALLDEIERRDPVGFEAFLVRAGWRQQQRR